MEISCGTCRYYVVWIIPDYQTNGPEFGYCRRYPPHITHGNQFPQTYPHLWCGEWKDGPTFGPVRARQ